MLLAIVPALFSCSDPLGPAAEPFPVLWVEWPAAVSAAQPGGVLVTFVDDFCSTTSLGVAADFPNVTVRSEITRHSNVPCPLADLFPAFPHDSLIPLPSLATPYGIPAYYSMQATLSDPFGTPSVHTLGQIQVAAAADTTRYMAGTGTVFVDSAGCPVVVGGFGFGPNGPAHLYAIQNPPHLDSIARQAMVGAHIVTDSLPPVACGSHRLVHLDYAIVWLVP